MRKKQRNRLLKGKARRGTTVVIEKEPKRASPYMGSVITVNNRRDFIEAQKKLYIDNHHQFHENMVNEIMSMEGTEEEKALELEQLAQKKLSEGELEKQAEGFAKFQANKESKHYKAYLAGKLFYKYKGQMWPVVTEESLAASRGLINIENVESNDEVYSGVNTGESIESTTLDPILAGN